MMVSKREFLVSLVKLIGYKEEREIGGGNFYFRFQNRRAKKQIVYVYCSSVLNPK